MVIKVNIEEFDPDSFEVATKHCIFLEFATSGIPVLLINGRKPGKTLLAMAGVHGDEFAGIRAIHQTCRQLDPEEMSGRLLAVPVANLPAFWASTRNTPIDGLNLARIFPGKKEGSVTEQIAYYLSEKIIARADFLIDLTPVELGTNSLS
jgi:predicted deacylase